MKPALTIIGGFYRELCRFPRTDDYFGSGGRAAAALSELEMDIRLYTATDPLSKGILASLAHVFQFDYKTVSIDEGLRFEYQHPLAAPMILPEKDAFNKVALSVEAHTVLQFGMLEADVEVTAETLVYDPQNPSVPQAYKPKGRDSMRFAYVLNAREAHLITGCKDSRDAAKRLQNSFGAHAVAIKEGPNGALVLESGIETLIPSYRTTSVWPIGSGDVFAATFAALWGVERQTAADAALAASRAAAFYVESRTLPIPKSVVRENHGFDPISLQATALCEDEYHVYLAGPFFTMAQLWLVEEARLALKGLGMRVFSPIHEVGFGGALDVAPKDIEGLKKSRVVLAIVDGLDTGTIYEVGYARALGKPVIAFAECTEDEPLKMLIGTDCTVVRDFTSAIYNTAWASR